MRQQLNIPSPLQQLGVIKNGIELFVKREDLIHPLFGGNKWRKLKYNLTGFRQGQYKTLITFGGAFSNHIAATAYACDYYKIKAVGIIRGEMQDMDNPTLKAARGSGMIIHNIPKKEYSLKDNSVLVQDIIKNYDKPLLLPEGGSNLHARKGVMELIDEIEDVDSFDFIFVPAGTGMTASGIISGLNGRSYAYVVNVLKNKSLNSVIANNLLGLNQNWKVLHDYSFGGYAKVNEDLKGFNSAFWKQYGILLDPVYNAKAMYALFDLVIKEQLPPDSRLLYIHTGGLQGIPAYEYVHHSKWL